METVLLLVHLDDVLRVHAKEPLPRVLRVLDNPRGIETNAEKERTLECVWKFPVISMQNKHKHIHKQGYHIYGKFQSYRSEHVCHLDVVQAVGSIW
eukprot:COSAG05_NODE_5677_length_1117_cov_36.014803_2_plen_96_part_00